MSYQSNKKKKVYEMAEKFKPYWMPLFKHYNIENPKFLTKLAYNSNSFSTDGTKTIAISFFEKELDYGKDLYLELCDWDNKYYFSGQRRLYVLKYYSNWRKYVNKYIPKDMTTYVVYAIKLTDLTLVNSTSISSTIPIIKEEVRINSEDEFDENKEDEHFSKMTIRDNYCIIHNVPLSNKKWLNELINKNKNYAN